MSLRKALISRLAKASPMESAVNSRPLGSSTRAPFLRHRSASGISDVTAMSHSVARSTIQSSAASKRPLTTTSWKSGSRGRFRRPLATTWTFRPCRLATRKTSSFTGQASAST